MTLSTDRSERRAAEAEKSPPPDTLSPADRYGELFAAVQTQRVFADSKTFVDCAPRGDPKAILAAWRQERHLPGFDLAVFVHAHFDAPVVPASGYVSLPGQPLPEHIDRLWPVLTRQPREHPAYSSALKMPHAYIVPGGRFAELYYWDTYFTMLGLPEGGRGDLLQAMTDNFAYLIDTYGHVPNGTRTYYLSRSQPPVFALMVELCEGCGGPARTGYLPQLLAEHAFWMDGAESLARGEARRRVVRLPDGTLLNRYWDDREAPREEAYLEDVRTAQAASTRPAGEVWRDLRAAAESGWDFSTRWLRAGDGGPGTRLADIRTTAIVPVDLNALLFRLELVIGQLARAGGDIRTADAFRAKAHARRRAVVALMWDEARQAFFDHDWQLDRRRSNLTAAALVPLFCGLAPPRCAEGLAQTVRERLLAPGGLATTETSSSEQWDRPNGWAPLQWMAIRGLAAYGRRALARDIAGRWLTTVSTVYRREAKLVEKYALRPLPVRHATGGSGGEYPLQDGFGWTNGVTRRLLREAPEHEAQEARAREDEEG